MTQKQVLGMVVGGALVVLVSVFVYRQYTQNGSVYGNQTPDTVEPTMNRKDTMVPVPEKLDDITAMITEESADDFSALDEEAAGAAEEIDADSDSVNNFGTSYDENSF